MQVLGGICLLVFLLSVGHVQNFDGLDVSASQEQVHTKEVSNDNVREHTGDLNTDEESDTFNGGFENTPRIVTVDENQNSETSNSYPYIPLPIIGDSFNNPNMSRQYSQDGLSSSGTSSAQAYAEVNVDSNAQNQWSIPSYSPARPDAGGLIFPNFTIPQPSTKAIAQSRIIWPNEYIYPQNIPGAEHVIQCTRENELYYLWTSIYSCLVCICINKDGLLEPVCASCAGCKGLIPNMPTPKPYVPLPIPSTEHPWNIQSSTLIPAVKATCKPLPVGLPFTNPLQPCQLCVCREMINEFGKIDVRIDCHDNPNCIISPDIPVIPPIPDVPVPLKLCKKLPPNVLFPHPTEHCKQCKCSVELSVAGIPEEHITCFVQPDCVTTTCKPLPVGQPFINPFQPCQLCICSETTNAFGKVNVRIDCQNTTQCVHPDVTVIPPTPDIPVPVPLPLCKKFPPNVLFPHPTDKCKQCKCSVETSAAGVPEQHITCFVEPDCLPWPSYISTTMHPSTVAPPSPGPKPILETCKPLPINQPFTNPLQPCQLCVCREHVNAYGNIDVRIDCHDNPNCVVPPDVIILPPMPDKPVPVPVPLSLCEKLPQNVMFPHPTEQCKQCKCSKEISAAGIPEEYITCFDEPNCVSASCKPLPVGQAFPNPLQPCQLCFCSETVNVDGRTDVRIDCQNIPHCVLPPDIKILPPMPDVPIPVPLPLCEKFPPNVAFPHPFERCKQCVCTVEMSSEGTSGEYITCFVEPDCAPLPLISTTMSPSTSSPSTPRPLLTTCKPLPTGEPFTNPLQPCQLCICKEIVDGFGVTDVRIDCQDNHNCVVPPDVVILPPMPVPVPVRLPLCEKFPLNVMFPHPTEHCKQCKCSIKLSPAGIPEHYITCFDEPDCVPWPVISTTVTPPIPAPVTPIGPLPGPPPHDSCQPYPPNQPFDHPWDPCQVCQCSEIKRVGLINIEISCYTKLSCCIIAPDGTISGAIGTSNGEITPIFNGPLSSTSMIPPLYNSPGIVRDYANSNVHSSASAFSTAGGGGSQSLAEANVDYNNLPSSPYYNPGGSAQAHSQAGATANVTNNGARYPTPSAVYNHNPSYPQYNPLVSQPYVQSKPIPFNRPPSFLRPYNSETDNQAYAEAIAQQKDLGIYSQTPSNSVYNAFITSTYRPPNIYTNPNLLPNQVINGQYNGLMMSTPNPSPLYSPNNLEYGQYEGLINMPYKGIYTPEQPRLYPYNTGILNQAAASAVAQNSFNDISQSQASTLNPLPLYSPNNLEYGQHEGLINMPYKGIYRPEKPRLYPYNMGTHNQAAASAVAQNSFNDITQSQASTPHPTILYSHNNLGYGKNQGLINTPYKGIYEKPRLSPNNMGTQNQAAASASVAQNSFNGISQSQAHAESNVQNSLTNPRYPSSPYQSAKALSNVNSGDQSSAVAEAKAQSQGSSNLQAQSQAGINNIPKSLHGYPLINKLHPDHPNHIPAYQGLNIQSLNKHKLSPVKYLGNLRSNGQTNSINVISPRYSQTSNLHLNPIDYTFNSIPRTGQFGSSNVQDLTLTKMKTRSEEGHEHGREDGEDKWRSE